MNETCYFCYQTLDEYMEQIFCCFHCKIQGAQIPTHNGLYKFLIRMDENKIMFKHIYFVLNGEVFVIEWFPGESNSRFYGMENKTIDLNIPHAPLPNSNQLEEYARFLLALS